MVLEWELGYSLGSQLLCGESSYCVGSQLLCGESSYCVGNSAIVWGVQLLCGESAIVCNDNDYGYGMLSYSKAVLSWAKTIYYYTTLAQYSGPARQGAARKVHY